MLQVKPDESIKTNTIFQILATVTAWARKWGHCVWRG